MPKKIELIKLSNDKYYVKKHIKSKYYNDFTGEIIDLDLLLKELVGYANAWIIDLDNAISILDINNNNIPLDEIYDLLDSYILINKLMNKVFINFSKGLDTVDWNN